MPRSGIVNRYSPSAGKVVSELHPAARAERKAVDVDRLIALSGWAIVRAGDLGHGFANGQPRREPRGGDILIEERGRDAQRRGDVVEPVDFDLGRQECFGVELDAQQIVDGRAELRPRQALDRHVPRLRPTGGLERRGQRPSSVASIHVDERVDLALIRLAASGRRHQPAAQLAHGLFPDVGVLVNRVQTSACRTPRLRHWARELWHATQ